jgi:hypothetical protein
MRCESTLVGVIARAVSAGCLLLAVAGEAIAAIPVSERGALIALYNSTNGAGWTQRTNWRNAADTDFSPPGTECTWYGVTCAPSEAHVVGLMLYSNQLAGPIPPQIGDFPSLTEIDLGVNALTGPIPSEIADLSLLLSLDVSGNELDGAIPGAIGKLKSLLWLGLNGNMLTGPIPPEIGNLARLSALRLEDNQLSGSIPTQIGRLTNLYILDLSDNQLSGPIPEGIGNLGHLNYLYLDGNRLTGSIPRGIGRMASLFELFLARNSLTGSIPPEIGNLTLLLTLRLEGNELSGPIPDSLASLPRLVPGWTAGGSDLRWNALFTSDPGLREFLDSKQLGGDWESTQTVAPTDLAPGFPGVGTVPLSWTPILYTGDPGGYRLWYGTLPGGPYNLAETTADKAVSASTVSDLSPGTTYFFALDTVTDPHADNQNTVTSRRTSEVSAATTTGGPGWLGLTVMREGPGTVSSSPGGIACGGACSATFAPGTPVALTAAPEAGSGFLGWGGACSGSLPTCALTMDSPRTVKATFSPPSLSFYTLEPCRVYDSRDAGLGGPSPLPAGAETAVAISGYCGVPATARAVSLNVTVVSPAAGGHLRLYASDAARPGTSTINYGPGQTRANNAIVSLGANGAITVSAHQPGGAVHVVLDLNGFLQ